MLVNMLSHKSDAQHLNLRAVSPVAADPFNVAIPMPVLYIDGKMDNQRSADSDLAALLGLPIHEPVFQASAFDPAPFLTFRAQLASWPAPVALRQDVEPTPTAHAGHRAMGMSVPGELVDDIFSRDDWLSTGTPFERP